LRDRRETEGGETYSDKQLDLGRQKKSPQPGALQPSDRSSAVLFKFSCSIEKISPSEITRTCHFGLCQPGEFATRQQNLTAKSKSLWLDPFCELVRVPPIYR
jgi:hypothetical protein